MMRARRDEVWLTQFSQCVTELKARLAEAVKLQNLQLENERLKKELDDL